MHACGEHTQCLTHAAWQAQEEKKKYLKVAQKANQNAQKAARNTAAAANQLLVMQAATALGKRRRNASPSKRVSRARVTMVSVRSTGGSM